MGLDAEWLLSACRAVDPQAAIATVCRDSDGKNVVRVRGSSAQSTSRVLEALRVRAPYMKCGTVENHLDGAFEAWAALPTRREALECGRRVGRASLFSRAAETAGLALVLSFVVLTAKDFWDRAWMGV